jgi:large subunit ribosomal protein L4
MATIRVYSSANGSVITREEDTAALGKRPHRRLLREAVLMYAANRRSGTHSTKTRAEVHYTNKKPWKQKHTGRARAGTRRSPLWRGGGVIFGPRPRKYGWAMPRKALRAATRSALLGKASDGEVSRVIGLELSKPSTKAFAAVVQALGLKGTVLFVLEAHDDVMFRSARNIAGATVRVANDINALDLLAHRNVVLVNGALGSLNTGLETGGGNDE